jgi:hypothetical protein
MSEREVPTDKLEELTDDQLAEYHLAWAPDGSPSLRYADRYDIAGIDFEVIEEMFEDGASKDDIVLFLHEVASAEDEIDEEIRQWQVKHPIRHAVAQLGHRMALWAHRPWMESQ